MANEQVQEIPLDDIAPHPGNRRVGGFDKAKLEQLAESIRAVGVQQPAVVRLIKDQVHHGGGQPRDRYQLVAGERRWRAARLAGLETLPCVVRDLDDVQVLKIQTIENLQREDIHPLDEAGGFQRLIEVAKYDVPTIAHEIGKSPSYVYQRLKLQDLVPAARKMLEDGRMHAGHAIQVARLNAEDQKRVLEWWGNARDGEVIAVRALAEMIEQDILMDLSKAAFKKDDKELLPEAGSCKACQKRTGYEPALFEDLGDHDRCLDRDCYRAKLDALVTRKRVELATEPHLEVVGGWDPDVRRTAKEKGVLERYEWTECKKKDEGAERVLYVSGPERGQTTWGKKNERQALQKDPARVAEEKERKEAAKLRQTERRGLYDLVVAGATAWYAGGVPAKDNGLMKMIAEWVVGLIDDYSRRDLCALEGWKGEKGETGRVDWKGIVLAQIPESPDGILLLLIKTAMLRDLDVSQWYARNPRTLYAAADALGVPHPEPDPDDNHDDLYEDDQLEDEDGNEVELEDEEEPEDEKAGA